MKKIYFLCDAHLGSWAISDVRKQEMRVVRFLDGIKEDAGAVYMLGDMFDFWHEYRYVVPKGSTRLLGKISELTDRGIEVHFFTGNHDLWCGNYLEKECGVMLHREMLQVQLGEKIFCMAHGDGLDESEKRYLFLRNVFHNKICQKLFAAVHPRWGMCFGLAWARHSRMKHEKVEGFFEGVEKDGIYRFSRQMLEKQPEIDYFIYGHRHVDVDLMMNDKTRFIILGDWVTKFTYGVFDGTTLEIKHFQDKKFNVTNLYQVQ